MKRAFLIAVLLTGCGTTHKDGTCKDYTPAMSCPAGFDYVCETNEDGCKRCTCVQNKNFPEAPGYDD